MEEIIIANERKKLPPNEGGLRGLSMFCAVMLLLFSAVILSLPKDAFAFRLPDSASANVIRP